MNIISVVEARNILGTRANQLNDSEIEKLIIFLESLCNKFIEEVVKKNAEQFN